MRLCILTDCDIEEARGLVDAYVIILLGCEVRPKKHHVLCPLYSKPRKTGCVPVGGQGSLRSW